MKQLHLWIRGHPWTACAFAFMFVLCGVIWESVNWRAGLGFAGATFAVLMLVIYTNPKSILGLTIAASLLLNPPLKAAEPPPLPALCLAGAVVLVIGGVVGCKIVKKGARIARGRGTNDWPEDIIPAGAGHSECGAVFTWAEECYGERSSEVVPVACSMSILIESRSNLVTRVRADAGSGFVESFDEFKEELAFRALSVPDRPEISAIFEINRQPATAEQVPITWDYGTRTATIGGGGVLVSVEASDDLEGWTTLLRINAPEGQRLEVADASVGRRFYRITAQEP